MSILRRSWTRVGPASFACYLVSIVAFVVLFVIAVLGAHQTTTLRSVHLIAAATAIITQILALLLNRSFGVRFPGIR